MQSTQFDIAILDVNVNGKVITPVAELITARNRPFIFATGYGSSGLPQEYRDRPALQKPFQLETLAQVIASTLKRATVQRLRTFGRHHPRKRMIQYLRDLRLSREAAAYWIPAFAV